MNTEKKYKLVKTKEDEFVIFEVHSFAKMGEDYSLTCFHNVMKVDFDKVILWGFGCPKIIAATNKVGNLPLISNGKDFLSKLYNLKNGPLTVEIEEESYHYVSGGFKSVDEIGGKGLQHDEGSVPKITDGKIKITKIIENWDGVISNVQVLAKQKRIKELNSEISILNEEIKKIQDDCVHEYKKTFDGEYDTEHTCIHCGYKILN